MTDREKVIEELEHCRQLDFEMKKPTQDAIDNALALLKEQPEIVRCEDCKWYSPEISWCNNSMSPKEQTFFCADGKRR